MLCPTTFTARKAGLLALGGAMALLGAAAAAQADITLYQDDDFQGRAVASSGEIPDLKSLQFNDQASSLVIRGERWTLCSDAGFKGQCVSLGPGRYPSLSAMGLNDRLSSLRPEGGNGWNNGGWQGGGWGGLGVAPSTNVGGNFRFPLHAGSSAAAGCSSLAPCAAASATHHTVQYDVIHVGIQIQRVANTNGLYQKAQFSREFFTNALDSWHELPTRFGVNQGDQAVANLQANQIHLINVIPVQFFGRFSFVVGCLLFSFF